ncbi:MAG: dihydrolipoamide acetyltransferase family protein [Fimbriimonadaceae bacterium]
MPVEILMPELGESVHEGTVSRWLKKEGDFVKEDEPVVEIMTDKVNTELGAPASGVLSKILIQEGDMVEVFKAMGIIDEGAVAGKPAPTPTPDAQSAAVTPITTNHEPQSTGADPASAEERRFYTPVVRSIAKEKGISPAELANIAGTGEGGRVTKKHVEAYIAGQHATAPRAVASPPDANATVPRAVSPSDAQNDLLTSTTQLLQLTGMRKMIADAMVRSSQVPTVSTVTRCDVTTMVHFRERNKDSFLEEHGVKLTYTPFFIKALAESLKEFPLVNSSMQADNQIAISKGVHIGVAVALGPKGEDGLIVPVIRDCQSKGLIEIAKDLDVVAKAARSNSLKPADVQGGTCTFTNPGTYGALFGTPMINSPQAAILGGYAINKEPVVINDMIAIRSMMHLVLTYDHRIIDGLVAGKFLASVRDRLQAFDFFK